MLVHEVVLVVFSCALVVGTAWTVRRIAMNSDRRYELQVRHYLIRRSVRIAFILLQLTGSSIATVVGAAFIIEGDLLGWGLVALACVPVVCVAFAIYIARLPFAYPEDL